MAVSSRRIALWLMYGAVLVALASLARSEPPPPSRDGNDDDRIALLDGLLCPPPPALAPLITAVPLPLDAVGCALGAADVEVLTQYRRPDGTMLVRRHLTLIGVPALVNADPDLLPDVVVTPTIRNLHEFAIRIERMPLESSALPVSVELIVDDPTTGALPRDRIHLGYDARDTRAPRLFRSLITLGEEANGDPRVQLENRASYGLTSPAALTVVGGLFDGESLDRSDPLGGRLTYTPMPPTSTIDLGIGERYRVGLGASTPAALDAEVEMVTGANEKRATAHLDPLPTSLEASYVPGATADQRTVTVTSSATVDDVDLGYRETDGGTPLLGAVVHATDLPTQVTVEQTAERAGAVETNGAFGSVEFGLADGDPVLGTVDGPYVNLVDDGIHSSVAARVDGLKRASVDATDAIFADLEVTPAGRKPVAIDVERPGLVVTGSVADLPEHLTLTADLDGPVVTYDGHGQGIDDLAIEAVADHPLFARATNLRAHATDLPAAFVFEVRKRHVEPNPGLVLLDGVEVTSSAPIGTVEFEADDGDGSVLPAGNGATYLDTPARFAIAGRVEDFERVSLLNRIGGWTELGTTVGAGPFHVKLQTNDPTVPDDALLVEGTVTDLPHVMDARVRAPSETHAGALELEASAGIGDIDLRLEPEQPLLTRDGADPDVLVVGVEGVPARLQADVVATATGASLVLDHAVEEVEATLTSGPGGVIGDDNTFGSLHNDSGIYVRALPDQFVAMGRLRDVRELHFSASPLRVGVVSTTAHPFTIDAEVNVPGDGIPLGVISGEVLDLPAVVDFEEVGDGFEWDAHGETIDSLTLEADNLPGAGPVHFADLEIDDIPARFRILAGGPDKGVEALDGGSFGRIYAQVSDALQAPLDDPDAPGNRVQLETDDELTAFVRVHDLQRAVFHDGALSQDVDVDFGVVDPQPLAVRITTADARISADVDDPPEWLAVGMGGITDDVVTWDAADETDVDLRFGIEDTVGGDLHIQDLAPASEFCVSTFTTGCDSEFDYPHSTGTGSYRIPAVFHSYLRSPDAAGPLTLDGLICLKPVGVDDWSPICQWKASDGSDGPRNSSHQVLFFDVQVTEYQVDLHSGDSVELQDDGDPVEDDLIGGYVDIPSFAGRIRYQANTSGQATVFEPHSAVEIESFGDPSLSADAWEFVIDTTGGTSTSQIYDGGDCDPGLDSALRMWVLTQYTDLFELDDASTQVDLCSDE